MSGDDQYGRRLLLWGDTAEIFAFTFSYTDELSSVYEISMETTSKVSLIVNSLVVNGFKRLVRYLATGW